MIPLSSRSVNQNLVACCHCASLDCCLQNHVILTKRHGRISGEIFDDGVPESAIDIASCARYNEELLANDSPAVRALQDLAGPSQFAAYSMQFCFGFVSFLIRL